MRLKERIIPFFNKVDLIDLLESRWKELSVIESFDPIEAVKQIISHRDSIEKQWLENPDLRFSQILVNLNYIPNAPGLWYYEEEYDILIDQGAEPRDVLYWGKNYDKDENLLPETEYILIKDLTTDHIKGIFKFIKKNKQRLPDLWKSTLENELKLRKGNLKK